MRFFSGAFVQGQRKQTNSKQVVVIFFYCFILQWGVNGLESSQASTEATLSPLQLSLRKKKGKGGWGAVSRI